jgi:hypothetical protein
MKILRKLRWFFIVILIAVVGILLNENLFRFYISRIVFYSILAAGIVLSTVAYFSKPARRRGIHKFVIVLTIGFLLIPYLGLLKGYSNMFAKDQAGTTVKEIRFEIVKFECRKEGQDVWDTVMENRQATLYPGKNWVWLGKIDFSAPGHDRNRVITEIETDIVWDQNIISQEHPDWGVPVPGQPPDCIKSQDLGQGKYLITFFHRDEKEGPMLKPKGLEEGPKLPFAIQPDLGLDIVVGEDGRFMRNAFHVLLPEPFGDMAVEIPHE